VGSPILGGMKYVIALAMLVALLQGCATRLDLQGPDAEGGLRFQTSAVAPQGDEAPVSEDTLEPGDIILTSDRRCARWGSGSSRCPR
jgi:hypothetical protein